MKEVFRNPDPQNATKVFMESIENKGVGRKIRGMPQGLSIP